MAGLLGLAIGGCAAGPNSAPIVELPRWELTVAQPVRLLPIVRTRVSSDRPIPPHLVQDLCPEYHLVTIRRPADWSEVHRRLGLPAELAHLDLDEGPVIGILAFVGEHSRGKWPLRLSSIRISEGAGLLDAVFLPGFYHPLNTAGYLELAQVKGLSSVTTVRINSRMFTIHSARASD